MRFRGCQNDLKETPSGAREDPQGDPGAERLQEPFGDLSRDRGPEGPRTPCSRHLVICKSSLFRL